MFQYSVFGGNSDILCYHTTCTNLQLKSVYKKRHQLSHKCLTSGLLRAKTGGFRKILDNFGCLAILWQLAQIKHELKVS